MSFATVDHAAGLLADLRMRIGHDGTIDDLPPTCRPETLFEAYEIQTRVRELLSRRRPGKQVGWKIGCTTEVMQEYLQIPHPCAGTLYEHTLHRHHAVLQAEDYMTLGLECEIAVELSRDLPKRPTLYTREAVARAISGVMASIEIVEHRFRDFRTAATNSLVADDFFSAGCVVGEAVSLDEAGSMAGLSGGFSIDGAAPRSTGSGAEILTHPLTALAWLADHTAALGEMLKAGQIITLGSVVKTIYPQRGQRIEARFDRLPPVSIEVI